MVCSPATIPPYTERGDSLGAIRQAIRESTPTGVVSLLDMLEVKGNAWTYFATSLGELRFKVSETLHHQPVLSNQVPPNDIFDEFITFMKHAAKICTDLECDAAGHQAAMYLSADKEFYRYANIQSALDGLMITFIGDVGRKFFLQLTGDDSKLFSEKPKELFGSEVAAAFPSAAGDIQEAANCLALNRWPASAYHCMRVLERGLAALATKFGVTSDHTNWHNIIEQVQANIRKIDSSFGADWKKQQQDYGEIARRFMFLKDAWRNHVMHVRDEYDQGRAKSVWDHTKELMQQLAKVGIKE